MRAANHRGLCVLNAATGETRVNLHVCVWSLTNSKPGQVGVKFRSSHKSRKESEETRGSPSWLLERQRVLSHLLRRLLGSATGEATTLD